MSKVIESKSLSNFCSTKPQPMKTIATIAVVFALTLFIGCATQHRTTLTAVQAKTLAQQLANDEAFARYACKPFHDGQAARFEQGHWVWSDRHGYGTGDLEALVIIAADGSTHEVKLTVSYSSLLSLNP